MPFRITIGTFPGISQKSGWFRDLIVPSQLHTSHCILGCDKYILMFTCVLKFHSSCTGSYCRLPSLAHKSLLFCFHCYIIRYPKLKICIFFLHYSLLLYFFIYILLYLHTHEYCLSIVCSTQKNVRKIFLIHFVYMPYYIDFFGFFYALKLL